jgi:hypothetical protein
MYTSNVQRPSYHLATADIIDSNPVGGSSTFSDPAISPAPRPTHPQITVNGLSGLLRVLFYELRGHGVHWVWGKARVDLAGRVEGGKGFCYPEGNQVSFYINNVMVYVLFDTVD